MGSNLSQVFIANAHTALSGTTFNSSGAGADDVGIWKLDATAGYTLAALYDGVIAATSDDSSAGDLTLVSPLWTVRDFQVVQRAVTGNFIASPIINKSYVKRIDYKAHVVTAAEFTTLDIGASAIAGDEIQLKVIVRAAPTAYGDFADSGNAINDITGGGKVCPIAIHNNTHHKAFNITSQPADRLAETAGADDELGLYDDLLTKINAHPVLKDLLKPTDNAGSGLKIETRFANVTVEFIYNNITDGDSVTSTESGYVTKTAFVAGSGNDWQVFSDELRCRSRQGNFNRMYFPQTMDTYVTNGHLYDKIVIEYELPNWPNGSGIAPAGGRNQAVIYYSNDGAAPGTTAANEFDVIFGYTGGTDATFVW